MGDPRHSLGLEAEAAVAAILGRAGWRVLARRYRSPSGELDLVCLSPELTLVGIEVRARRSGRAGRAIETVSRAKLARLRAGLASYAASAHPRHRSMRVDLVTLDRQDGRWRMVRHPGIDAW
ncbi:MAG TPA: YraN family protein [Candidatus Limnocylindria bacterium]|nr:YraN family protein [Candidatus Limnocylindria bacterium]